ncbi:MAG: beta strand repeat-containing protein [Paracoccaceae bacterium]
MSTIQFVVRTSAGEIQRGAIGDAGTVPVISLGAGDDVSLNLRAAQIASYSRVGDALEIILIDGSVVVIEGYFTDPGEAANTLYISADGTIATVELGYNQDGLLRPSYVDGGGWTEKYGDGDLFFMRGTDLMAGDLFVPAAAGPVGSVGVLPILGGLGALAAGAALLGGGGDDDDDGGDPGAEAGTPTVTITGGVASTGTVVNADDRDDGVTITGTGDPVGTAIVVTLTDPDGNEIAAETVVGEDGTWAVDFPADQFPDGEYEWQVTVTGTSPDGEVTTITDTLVVDTVVELTVDEASIGGDGVIDGSEGGSEVVLTGTVEVGSTVVVTIDGVDYPATVGDDGVWTCGVPGGTFDGNDIKVGFTVTATDPNGNTTTVPGTVDVDTIATVTLDAVTGDNAIDRGEAGGPVTLTGTADPGSAISIQVNGTTLTGTAGADGTWSITATPPVFAGAPAQIDIVVTATDPAGNVASVTQQVSLDTIFPLTIDTPIEGDDLVNAAEMADGVQLSGTAEPGASLTLSYNGASVNTQADASGNWTATFPASAFAVTNAAYQAQVSVSTTDGFGNTQTGLATFDVDLAAGVGFQSGATGPLQGQGAITGGVVDGVINDAEASNGVLIGGTADAGATVTLTYGTTSVTGTADSSGNWSIQMPSSAFGPAPMTGTGSYIANMSVSSVDTAGNASGTVNVAVPVDRNSIVSFDASGTIEGDGTVNRAEASNGVPISGDAEPGATVVVTISYDPGDGGGTQTFSQTTVAGAAGSSDPGGWTVNFGASTFAMGTYTVSAGVVATDLAGNVTSPAVNLPTFEVDMTPPAAVIQTGAAIDMGSIQGTFITAVDTAAGDEVSFQAFDTSANTLSTLNDSQMGPTFYTFSNPTVETNHILATVEDDADNTSTTLMLYTKNPTLMPPSALTDAQLTALESVDIDAIDVSRLTDAALSLTLSQVKALSDLTDDVLIVDGDLAGNDSDQLTLTTAAGESVARNGSETVNSVTYKVYEFTDAGGLAGRVLVDDDVAVLNGSGSVI